jgi:hypothetical protein
MLDRVGITSLIILTLAALTCAQKMPQQNSVSIKHIDRDLAVSDLHNAVWKDAAAVNIDSYWNKKPAPLGRRFAAKLLWSDTHFYVRFEAEQREPLVVSSKPDTSKKTMNLWDRDVCEIFLAPDRKEPRKYFEFEVAPTGEWIDVALDATSGKRVSDWDYASGMEASAAIGKGTVLMAVKIPWKAFGKAPRAGDVWLGNIFRCIGKDPDRGYLAWSPTLTDTPNFHVPERFGEFVFVR